jgi:hypothetical protein
MPIKKGEKTFRDAILRIAAVLFFLVSLVAVFKAGVFCKIVPQNPSPKPPASELPAELPRLAQNEFYKKASVPAPPMVMDPVAPDPRQSPAAGGTHLTD